jgi:flagellar biosynthetic protein FliO
MTHLANGITLSGWILVAVLNTGTLWAQDSTAVQTIPAEVVAGESQDLDADLLANAPEDGMTYWGVASKLGMGLALVILLAWGGVYLLRQSTVGQQFSGLGKTIRIAERTYLSPKKAIYLVEIGDRTLALGVTDEHITPLSEWQAGELELAPAPAPGGAFAKQFKKLLKQGPQKGNDA